MLTEFALTPSIFDENAHVDKESWKRLVRELGISMFPRVSAWPVVVSDLYDGSWKTTASQMIGTITDDQARRLCKDLFKKIENTLVRRSACGIWPEDDIAWVREAIASSNWEPIERIVTTFESKSVLNSNLRSVRSLEEVENEGFWHDISSHASPRMIIRDQVALLRKLCLHSEWIAYINPYALTSEVDFSLQLLSSVLKREPKSSCVHFEFHIKESEPPGSSDRQQNVIDNFAKRIRSQLSSPKSVEVYFWPRFLERILLAGDFTTVRGGVRSMAVRWGISMNHVAHGNDPEVAPAVWNLLNRESILDWNSRFIDKDASGKPAPTPIF